MHDQLDLRLARLEQLCAEQDESFRRLDARTEREVAALKAAISDDTAETLPDTEQNRLTLLDRLADRCPDLGHVGEHEVDWIELTDGDEALVLDRTGFTDGTGAYFMLDSDDVLAIGPLGPTATGVVVIRPDGSRQLVSVTRSDSDS